MNAIFAIAPRWSALLVAAALAACSSGPGPGKLPAQHAAVSASEVAAVQALLMQGDRKTAEKQLKGLLKREPMNAPLLLLRQSLTGDPKEMLGPRSYEYAVRAGDTIEGLAGRLLGNGLKAYQLARYNGLAMPVMLTPGQTLRIPGVPPQPERQPQPTERPAPRPSPSVAKPTTAPIKPKPAPVAPVSDPAAAQQARAAGLAALNRGAPKEAVRLLQRASTLDPASALIRRDLQRAQRIAATVQAQR